MLNVCIVQISMVHVKQLFFCTENFVLFNRQISAFNQGKFFCKKLAHLRDVQSDRNTIYAKNI